MDFNENMGTQDQEDDNPTGYEDHYFDPNGPNPYQNPDHNTNQWSTFPTAPPSGGQQDNLAQGSPFDIYRQLDITFTSSGGAQLIPTMPPINNPGANQTVPPVSFNPDFHYRFQRGFGTERLQLPPFQQPQNSNPLHSTSHYPTIPANNYRGGLYPTNFTEHGSLLRNPTAYRPSNEQSVAQGHIGHKQPPIAAEPTRAFCVTCREEITDPNAKLLNKCFSCSKATQDNTAAPLPVFDLNQARGIKRKPASDQTKRNPKPKIVSRASSEGEAEEEQLTSVPTFTDEFKSPGAAMDFINRPPPNQCQRFTVEGDDVMEAKRQFDSLCSRLLSALTEEHEAPPDAWTAFEKQYYKTNQENARLKIDRNLSTTFLRKHTNARIYLAIAEVINVHETGIPKKVLKEVKHKLGYKPDCSLTTIQRAEKLISAVQKNKCIGQDVLDGTSVGDLARSPDLYLDRKLNNTKGNAHRAEMKEKNKVKKVAQHETSSAAPSETG